MSRRRELKGICLTFSELLNGRNNEYLGYWAIGNLYLLANNKGVNSISLSLVNFSNSLNSSEVELMAKHMRSYFDRIFNAHKIPHDWVNLFQ
jgi:diaminopimelate decarboxylase